MSSMTLTTTPTRRIVDASPELAENAGSEPHLMCGLDCASIVRCRNAEGKPLCNHLCPALAAARGRSGMVDRVQLWLENLDGEMEEMEASFQRIGGTAGRMVVAFFGEPRTMESGLPQRKEVGAHGPSLRVVS
jgi:hypothetical protein